MIKKILFFAMITVFAGRVSAQIGADSIKNEIKRINAAYDSATYLAFDVNTGLTSDTSLGYYENDYDIVSYKLNGKNIFYSTKEAEYMQDDSFSITAFREDHVMYVTKVKAKTSTMLPLQSFNDSSLHYYLQYYNFSLTNTTNGETEIRMSTDSLWALYKQIIIRYRPANHLMTTAEFYFNDVASGYQDSTGVNDPKTLPMLHKKLNMQFQNYKLMPDGNMFSYKKYIWYDSTRREFIACGAFKGYRVVTTNMPETTNYLNE